MADTNPYNAGVFYQGSFITDQFTQTFDELFADKRLSIFVTIAAKPDVSVLCTNHSNTPLEFNNLGKSHAFYYVNTSGVLTASGSIPTFTDKAIRYINSSHEPRVFVLTDQNGGLRYLYANQTAPFALNSTPTKLAGLPDSWYQFFGQFIEFVGQDGQTIYRLTVNSSNVISVTPHRIEPQRTMAMYISHGHPMPYDGSHLYIGYLSSLGDITMSIEQTTTSFGGISIPTIGAIRVTLADGIFDYICNQSWDTREVTVRAGLSTDPINQYPVVLRAHTERAEWNLEELNITMRDQGILFDRAVQSNTYAGTGGYEGISELTGRPKPLAFGFVAHATPVLLDPVRNLYQFNDGPTHQNIEVAEGGSPHFTPHAAADLLTWNPTQTEVDIAMCRIDYSRGMFRLASKPEKALTFTQHGTTSVPITSTMADIIRAILIRAAPELTIDQSSFDYHKSIIGHPHGIYISDNQTVGDSIRAIAAPANDLVYLNRVERVILKHLQREPARAFITDRDIAQNATLGRREAPRPASEYRMAFQRSYTTFTEDQFLGSALGIFRVLLADEYRWLSFKLSGPTVPGVDRYESATTVEIKSFVILPHHNLLAEIAFRDHAMRDLYDVTVVGYSFKFDLGDTILLQLNRWDMFMPKTVIIVSITEMSPTGNKEDQTRLLLWG